jgi:hypothetical protein
MVDRSLLLARLTGATFVTIAICGATMRMKSPIVISQPRTVTMTRQSAHQLASKRDILRSGMELAVSAFGRT